MAKNHIRDAFGFEESTLKKHLTDIYTDYINSLLAGEAKNNANA
jgi:hypothetical protein